MKLKDFVGSGEVIGKMTLPFLIFGLILNITYPSFFSIGGPSQILKIISVAILAMGLINWLWSVILVLIKLPKKELITNGPFSVVKHPIYTGMAFLILPWAGFLLNSWLGVIIGIIEYIGSRKFAPKEEELMSKTFGKAWIEYCGKVKIPWL